MSFMDLLLGMLGSGQTAQPNPWFQMLTRQQQRQAAVPTQAITANQMQQPTGAQQLAQSMAQNPMAQQQNPQVAALQAMLPMLAQANAPQKKSLFGDNAFSDFMAKLPENLGSTYAMINHILGGDPYNPLTQGQRDMLQGQAALSTARNSLNRNQNALAKALSQGGQFLADQIGNPQTPVQQGNLKVDPKTGNLKVSVSGIDPSTLESPAMAQVAGLNVGQSSQPTQPIPQIQPTTQQTPMETGAQEATTGGALLQGVQPTFNSAPQIPWTYPGTGVNPQVPAPST